jgi:hypothetical protein
VTAIAEWAKYLLTLGVMPVQRRRARRLQSMTPLWRHLRSATNCLPGWVNVDLVRPDQALDLYWDLRRPLPLRDGSVDLLYVDDAAERIVLAAEKYDGPAPINIGTGQEITIRELVGLIVELTGFMGEVRWDPTKPDGQPRRALDIGRARQLLGFTARVPFREGLKRAVASYRGSKHNQSTAR